MMLRNIKMKLAKKPVFVFVYTLVFLTQLIQCETENDSWYDYDFRFKSTTRENENVIRENDIMDLDLTSHYCRLSTSFGKICDFSGTNKTIRVPVGLKYSQDVPAYIELKIQDAAALHVYPTCISWVQALRIQYLKTFPSDDNQLTNKEKCRTWLRIYDSKVDELSHGVLDVTLMNSNVSKINLKDQRDIMTFNAAIDHIEWLEWEGYKGHIANTTINKITKLIAHSDLLVVKSNFGVLEEHSVSLNGSGSDIFDTNINIIHSDGLNFLGRTNSLRNVTINKLHKLAINTHLATELTMSNVHITSADAPAFFFHLPENIKLENVTIEGEPLKLDSKWVALGNKESREVSNSTDLCIWNEYSATCNFKNFNDYQMILDFEKLDKFKPLTNLTIKNANIIEIINHPCNVNLTLIHCNISSLLHSKKINSTNGCKSTLKARNCEFEFLHSTNFNILDFENVKIRIFNSTEISYLHLKNCVIDEVENLVTKEDSRACIQHTKMNVIKHATFNEPLKIFNSDIISISGNMTFNHEDGSSSFTDSTIEYIGFGGLHLLAGHLQIYNVKIKHMQEQAIYLEERSSISINNSFSFPRLGRKSISALNKDQVEISIPALPIKTNDWLIYIRLPESQSNEILKEKFVLDGSTATSTLNSYCHSSGGSPPALSCDFQNMEVEVDLPFPMYLFIKNVSYLILHPACSSGLFLRDISNGTFHSSDKISCKTSVYVKNSSIHEIHGGARDFVVRSSHVEKLVPAEQFNSIMVLDSTISSIEGLEFNEVFEVSNSTINSIHMMRGLPKSEFLLAYSKVDMIDIFGVTLDKGFISHSVIDSILIYGLTVDGVVNIADTIIGHTEDESILVSGILNLQDVIIQNGSLNSFSVVNLGSLNCQNVTLKGKQIFSKDFVLSEQVTQPLVENPPTSQIDEYQNLGTHSPDNKESSNTEPPENKEPSDTEPPENQTPSDIMSFPDELEPPDKKWDNYKVNTQPSTKDQINNQPVNSFSWVAVLLGFLTGVAVTIIIAYGYILFRPDVQSLTPTIRWKVKDDEHDLILSDDEASGERI